MEQINCPLCASSETMLLFKRRDLRHHITDIPFNVVRCQQCSLVYINPRPSPDEIHSYYPEEYYSPDDDADKLLRDHNEEFRIKHQYLADIPPGRVLDIGCAKGEFLMFMRHQGWDVSGLDFSQKPPNVFGLDIRYGDLDNARFSKETFDLVTLWAVLEHVYDPLAMLSRIREFLKVDGSILLAATNFRSLPGRIMRQDDVPRHTILFTKQTLGQLLRLSGFKVDYIVCDCRLYGGTNRGIFNFLFKLAAGEPIDEIVAQNRSAEKWHQFSSQLRGKDSLWMQRIDRMDIACTPRLDPLLDKLGFGFSILARARKTASG